MAGAPRSACPTPLILVLLLSLLCFAAPTAAFFGRGGQAPAPPPAEQEEVDYYAVLGLTEEATEKEVRQKFRELSRKYHPDVAKSAEAKAMYGKINRANAVLSDKKKRRMYDMRGEEGLRQLELALKQGDQGNSMDPFARLFGMGGGGGLRGSNSEGTLHVDLEDVYRGGKKAFVFNKQKVCTKCKGSGASKGSGVVICSHCRGHGVVIQRLQLAPGMYQDMQQACPQCQGKGRVAKHKCPACNGNKVVRGDVTLTMDIEQGVPEGHKVRFEMESDESPELVPGDLIMTVLTKPHPRYSRRSNGLDLDASLTVTLKEALLGFERRMEHLDGTEVVVRATGVTPYGKVLKLRGKGMPRHHLPSEKGDLYVKVMFELPRSLTEAQKKEIAEQL
ncbi:putative chaperone DNAJ protein [Trypanosoma conorhini]|uniref:Putative chaperone DNAJ protein n=1 Tax=Trypanosoma conorhini TaxID=83891 RepID=A0A422QAX6_9TRYP|nr:putative chaperone DNAJ protein [Trypanosoma conorhini]RNF27119.1 putative chaperone DNAJ protein [Trypanosoma conorhini]